MVAIVPFLLH